MIPLRAYVLTLVVACAGVSSAFAQMPGMPPTGGQPATGMPDARTMAGIPMPMSDLPDGSVSVRVVRGQLTNTIPDQAVEISINGQTQTAKTDNTGRAQFTGLTPGATVVATATVAGERLESQPFQVPAKGGVRLLLVASGGGAAGSEPSQPAVAGTVTFGGDTRVVVEFEDDTLNVFYLLDVVNSGTAPVKPARDIAFDLPPEATGATVLEGSSPQAQVKGNHVTIAGPFNPGRTSVQIAYQLPPAGDSRTIVQPFPAAFDTVSIAVQQAGGVRLQSPQISAQQEMQGDGRNYVAGTGPALAAGRPLTIELSGVPHHDTWPRMAALLVAGLILCVGFWTAFGRPSGHDPRRAELVSRRDQLFAELLRIEEARRAGTADPVVCDDRRTVLMAELERVYGELDHPGPSGDRGMVA